MRDRWSPTRAEVKLKVLDLFSGIGGFSLGLERTGGFETVAFCEIEDFPRAVLRKHWPNVPIFEDVRTMRGEDVGPVDVICGGYPCQPFSQAGKRRGAEDDRHLWPEFSRLVAELRPSWVIGENVAGHISMGLDEVLSDLEGQGYACRTFVIPACAVDAPHRRDRVWTIGHANGDREPTSALNAEASGLRGVVAHSTRGGRGKELPQPGGGSEGSGTQGRAAGLDNRGASLADSEELQRDGGGEHREPGKRQISESGERGGKVTIAGERQSGWRRRSEPGRWLAEPGMGRVAHGVPRRVDRLKALGNAVVPQIPEMIGRAILAAETQHA